MWYCRGGRGSGKTRTGSEGLAELIIDTIIAGEDGEAGDWAIVAPTFGDARDVCVEGPSGIRHALAGWTDGDWQKAWNRSQGQLRLCNGATLFVDGADDGALRIQGKNLRGLWADEAGLWKQWEQAWDESIAFAVRLDPGSIIVTGTPKAGHGLVKRLVGGDPQKGIPAADYQTHMRMTDNLDNLSTMVVERLLTRYGGTTLGRQELEGELIDEVEGALWSAALIDGNRIHKTPVLQRVAVGVDPSGGRTETGIVAAGLVARDCTCSGDAPYPHVVILGDFTDTTGSPASWGRAVVNAYESVGADRVFGEQNFGGAMVEHTIRTVAPDISYKHVTASRGKAVRAEPIVSLYEQGRVHHQGTFADLESEMVTWEPEESAWSPNRLDALVWAVTGLNIVKPVYPSTVKVHTPLG